ncbi:MAG: S8 family peptidase [Gammaproteobacteria bacterium]
MSNKAICCFTVCLTVALVSCVPTDIGKQSFGVPSDVGGGRSEADNQLLVTFQDERIEQVPMVDPVNGYRRRDNYGNSTWSRRMAERLAEDYGLRIVTQWPIDTLGIHCVVYEVAGSQSPHGVLKRIAEDKRLETAQMMQRFKTMASTYNDPYYTLQSNMRTMHIESAHSIASGRNVKIALIDTGVDADHPDLKGQIYLAKNFVTEGHDVLEEIHGTAVAGVIAAIANNRIGIVGVAPDANLLTLKACWQDEPQKAEASCNTLTLALALNAAINTKVQIINMSLVGPQDPLLERLIQKALEEGIIVVAPELAQRDSDNDFPASLKGVIAVRSAESKSSKKSLDYTHSTTAPGMEILTTLPFGTYNFMSGSSFAAAHVSGLVALLLELNPNLTPERVIAILNASLKRADKVAKLPIINACAVIASMNGGSECPKTATRAD